MTPNQFLMQYMQGVGENELLFMFEEDRINEQVLLDAKEEHAWEPIERNDVSVPDWAYDIDGETHSLTESDVLYIAEFAFHHDPEIEVQVIMTVDGFLIGEFGRG